MKYRLDVGRRLKEDFHGPLRSDAMLRIRTGIDETLTKSPSFFPQWMINLQALSRLDAYIISHRFSPRKWPAPLISEKLYTTAPTRSLPAKVLADVIKALISTAYIDGGLYKAQSCILRFLPELRLTRLESMPVSQDHKKAHLIQQESQEETIGYTFNNKVFLTEALSHPSCQCNALTQPNQRLEFLGDAVLDMLIINLISTHGTKFSEGEMTKIKHAVVSRPAYFSVYGVQVDHTIFTSPKYRHRSKGRN
ncbi:ribonuclease III domain-containing protein [Aspergillus fruticulosus]